MPAESPLLADYPVSITLPVQWGEQDAFGHVNNIVYFRWFESARIAYGMLAGMDKLYAEQQLGPILAAVNCSYRKQLLFPDTVLIGARITKLGRTRLQMEHAVVSTAQQAIVAEGISTVVLFNYKGQKPIAISPDLRKAIESIEGKSLS